MTSDADLGGESACYAQILGEPEHDITTRADVEELVRAFYRDVAMDDILGPVFAGMRVDWSAHISKLVDFWSWQLLGQRGYEGNPLRAHEPVNARMPFTTAHYERWLELFETTVDEHFRGPQAELAKQRAHRMARSLRRLLAGKSAPGDVKMDVIFTNRR